MPIGRPFRRTCRQFVDGSYQGKGNWRFVADPRYAEAPEHYIRSFLMLQKDLHELFDYLEPADANQACYSYRIHALLLRACIEVEANCKAVLRENGYRRDADWNMGDYKKMEATHRLSSFAVVVPDWSGVHNIRRPFASWKSGGTLPWYSAYNVSKHDRYTAFKQATFEHLVDAICGVLVVLSAQFISEDFTNAVYWQREPHKDGTQSGIGQHFRVAFPTDWPDVDRYDFDWKELETQSDPFISFDYTKMECSRPPSAPIP